MRLHSSIHTIANHLRSDVGSPLRNAVVFLEILGYRRWEVEGRSYGRCVSHRKQKVRRYRDRLRRRRAKHAGEGSVLGSTETKGISQDEEYAERK